MAAMRNYTLNKVRCGADQRLAMDSTCEISDNGWARDWGRGGGGVAGRIAGDSVVTRQIRGCVPEPGGLWGIIPISTA